MTGMDGMKEEISFFSFGSTTETFASFLFFFFGFLGEGIATSLPLAAGDGRGAADSTYREGWGRT